MLLSPPHHGHVGAGLREVQADWVTRNRFEPSAASGQGLDSHDEVAWAQSIDQALGRPGAHDVGDAHSATPAGYRCGCA